MLQTHDLNVVSMTPLIPPRAMKADLPITERSAETVIQGRQAIQDILNGEDDRLLVIIGPCSIHDPKAALDFAQRLEPLHRELSDRLFIVMRTYFEKPRTTIGWKGLINDPNLDGSYDVQQGIFKARQLLLNITELGLPTATEVLDPIVPQYTSDLVSWVSIGARTTESQTHREMASGLSMPVGFKNNTDGNLQIALDAMQSARHAHHFLGMDADGRSCIVATRGNRYGHIILRGGRGGPNYDPVSITQAEEALRARNLPPRLLVDCSHDNSGKRYALQRHVLRSIVQQRQDGNPSVVGVLIESNLHQGNQKLGKNPATLRYGISITDGCIGWDTTEQLLHHAHRELGRKSDEAGLW